MESTFYQILMLLRVGLIRLCFDLPCFLLSLCLVLLCTVCPFFAFLLQCDWMRISEKSPSYTTKRYGGVTITQDSGVEKGEFAVWIR